MKRSNFCECRRWFATLLALVLFTQNLHQARAVSSNLILAQRDAQQNENLSWFEQQVVEGLREQMSANGLALSLAQSEAVGLVLQKELLGREEPLRSFHLDGVALGLLAARKAYYQFDFVGCLHLLRQTQSLEERRPLNAPFYAPIYEQGALLEGICHLALKENPEAERAFSEAIRLRPHEALNPLSYSPEVIRFYVETKERVEKNTSSRRGRVSLTSMPPFADVYWNAEYVGQTPLTLQHLAAGRHFVELRLNEHAPWYGQLNLASGDLTRVQAQLTVQSAAGLATKKPAENFTILNLQERSAPNWLEFMVKIGEVLRVKELTLLSFERRGDLIHGNVDVVDVEKKTLAKSLQEGVSGPFNNPQIVVEQILHQLLPQGRRMNVAGVVEPREVKEIPERSDINPTAGHERALFEREEPIAKEIKPKGKHWAQNSWIWITLGVLLAGAAAGTAIAMTQGGGGSTGGGFPANPTNGVVVTGNP